ANGSVEAERENLESSIVKSRSQEQRAETGIGARTSVRFNWRNESGHGTPCVSSLRTAKRAEPSTPPFNSANFNRRSDLLVRRSGSKLRATTARRHGFASRR